jgi:hypothetical protein
VIGLKIVLASPAARVRMVNPRSRSCTNHLASTANAGSYRTAAIVTPTAAQMR